MSPTELRELAALIEDSWPEWSESKALPLKGANYLRACADALEKVPVAWQPPGPVTREHPLECLVIVPALRQADGDWWLSGDVFLGPDSPIAWIPDTPEHRAMLDAAPTLQVQQCRADGRCQYAINSGAEGLGHCPPGKCVMPAQQDDEAMDLLQLALDALTCGDTGDDLEDSHRCGRCDENVDRNASVRQRIRALLEKRGAV